MSDIHIYNKGEGNDMDEHLLYLDNMSSILYSVILNSCGIKKPNVFTFVCTRYETYAHMVSIHDVRKIAHDDYPTDIDIAEDQWTMSADQYIESKLTDEEKVQLYLIAPSNLQYYATSLCLDFLFGTPKIPQNSGDVKGIKKLCHDVINSTEFPEIKNNTEYYSQESFIDDIVDSLNIINIDVSDIEEDLPNDHFYFTRED